VCSSDLYSYAQQDEAEMKKQKETFQKKLKEDQEERIQKFTSELHADDFQKEIIKQKLTSYYDEKKLIQQEHDLKYFEIEEKLNTLDATYFSDIKDVISEDTMTAIKNFIKDNTSELKKQKKKKKKKNRKDN
jgi:Mn-dependent DtxR family transcriptional regulator